MQEVPGTVAEVRVHLIKTWLRHGRAGDHIRPDGHEFFQDAFDVRVFRTSAVGGIVRCQTSSPESERYTLGARIPRRLHAGVRLIYGFP